MISDIVEINLKNLGILNIYDATEFLKYCHFPESLEKRDSSGSEFFINKLYHNFMIYQKYNHVSKKYVNRMMVPR